MGETSTIALHVRRTHVAGMPKKQQITVFYAWQSDRPTSTNSGAIRNALRHAIKRLKIKHPNFEIKLDEATREVSGGVNIATKIIEKLLKADIMVADVTPVTARRAKRPCSNPNVTYELGFGVAELGWDRVIPIFNEAFGDLKRDLPFDFSTNRVGRYTMREGDDLEARNDLRELMHDALRDILVLSPKRPAELRGVSSDKIKHDQDVHLMKRLMATLHIPTVEQHFSEMPHILRGRAIYHSERFREVVETGLFHLYDPVLSDAVERLHRHWSLALADDEPYGDMPNGRDYVFRSAVGVVQAQERNRVWNMIVAHMSEAAKALKDVVERLRVGYLEVDRRKANKKAWNAYRDFSRDDDELAVESPAKRKKAKKKRAVQ